AGIALDRIDARAVGQALCRAFIGSQLRQRLNPGFDVAAVSQPITLESILIDSGGRLRGAIGEPNDEAAVLRAIGTVMSGILRDGNSSALHSKIISKTKGSPPEFATVDALSKALDSFGGSNGRGRLR